MLRHTTLLFRFGDVSVNFKALDLRAVLKDSVPYKYDLYASFQNITSRNLEIPEDRIRFGGKIYIYGARGNNGNAGSYGTWNGVGGAGGSGGRGLTVTHPDGTLIAYGGGGGGGGGGGTWDSYHHIINAAGSGGAGGYGSENELIFKKNWSGQTLTLTYGNNGSSGSNGTASRGGNGGSAGDGTAGSSRSGKNGGRGGSAGTSAQLVNGFDLYEAIY